MSGAIMIDGEIGLKIHFKVKPFEKLKIEDEALKVGNVTREQIMKYLDMDFVYKELVSMLAKYGTNSIRR